MIRHGGGQFTLPLSKRKSETVEQMLEEMGYWYPPDAIAAVKENRETYHPIDPTITYDLHPSIKRIIQEAIAKLESKHNGRYYA